jgi:pyridoxal phosphate enzyme (YggS family)
MELEKKFVSLSERIAAAATRSGRDPGSVKLIVVTKTRSVEQILDAIRSGVEYIGENRVQEAEQKIPLLENKYKEFHFIGHLQSNKIKKLMALKPDLIHSIDSYRTAEKLEQYLDENGLTQNILIQVNTSGETTKSGIDPEKTIKLVKDISNLSHLKIKGLMTIGMLTSNESKIRGCFRLLRELSIKIDQEGFSNVDMKHLSMGMSGDFEIAIEEGADIVRIGSAVFGPRIY